MTGWIRAGAARRRLEPVVKANCVELGQDGEGYAYAEDCGDAPKGPDEAGKDGACCFAEVFRCAESG